MGGEKKENLSRRRVEPSVRDTEGHGGFGEEKKREEEVLAEARRIFGSRRRGKKIGFLVAATIFA